MKQKNNVLTRVVGGETIVLPTEGENLNRVLTLNGSGGYIWKLLETDRTVEELTDLTAEEYGISKEQAREDIEELLNAIKDYIE